MDPQADQCYGCGRTREEIAQWGSFSEEQRVLIMKDLPVRLQRLEANLKAALDQKNLME